jgi:hypothetical protein
MSADDNKADPKASEPVKVDEDSGITQAAADRAAKQTAADPDAGAGKTVTTDEFGAGIPTPTPTRVSDPTGEVSNRAGGTLQREPTPEELPSDVKIAPIAEQINPNANAQAVGAKEQPDEIAGVPQPREGEKNVKPDYGKNIDDLLPEDSGQSDDAARAVEDAERDADRGRY